jgi:methylmalonyl-CoA/ethylmalonyl-CoA epimerase
MAQITKINHVAIAVADIDTALGFWGEALGLVVSHIEEVSSQKAVVAFIPVGKSEIELVKPTSEDSGVGKFLSERGGGVHHLCFEVDDLDAFLAQLKSSGVRLINEIPIELPGRKAAFIHPKSANGVLVELYQLVDLPSIA